MRRRTVIRTIAGGAAVVLWGDCPLAPAQSRASEGSSSQSSKPLLGFKQYGMKRIPVRDAISQIAKIGYKSLSLTLMPSWDTEPKLLSKTDRADIRKRISDLGLVLASVMESLRLLGPNKENNLERLRVAADMAHELSPGAPAVIETTLGGRPAAWEGSKHQMADELGVWATTLEPQRTILAMEAHVGNAMDLPEKTLWMLNQVQSPWIGNLLDYSHYKLQGLDLRKTLLLLANRTVLHHLKDAEGTEENFRFLLPGETGKIDYKEYARVLHEIGYKGTVLAEVSTQISNKPEYDAVSAAKRCWDNLAPFFA
jgi:sugar phosphate isomerase/epimerase